MGGIGVAWMHHFLTDSDWPTPAPQFYRRQMTTNTRYWSILWLLGSIPFMQKLLARLTD